MLTVFNILSILLFQKVRFFIIFYVHILCTASLLLLTFHHLLSALKYKNRERTGPD